MKQLASKLLLGIFLVAVDAYVLPQYQGNTDVCTMVTELIQHMKGEKGPRGEPGPAGHNGTPGPSGPSGHQGDKGTQGQKGQRGEHGPSGPRGQDGAKGRDGSPGPEGRPGADGLPGQQGRVGDTGPVGPVGPPGPPGSTESRSGGVTYVRWGKSSCPNVAGTQLLYTGLIGGNMFNRRGGGGTYLCLPEEPEYVLLSNKEPKFKNEIFGTEYEHPITGPTKTEKHNCNAVCAVCFATTRAAHVMIPAKASCPSGWTREYYGYLMSQSNYWNDIDNPDKPDNQTRTPFICVDKDQDYVPGTAGNDNGAFLYEVEANCNNNTLPCSDKWPNKNLNSYYDDKKELNCVVCTK